MVPQAPGRALSRCDAPEFHWPASCPACVRFARNLRRSSFRRMLERASRAAPVAAAPVGEAVGDSSPPCRLPSRRRWTKISSACTRFEPSLAFTCAQSVSNSFDVTQSSVCAAARHERSFPPIRGAGRSLGSR